MLCGPSSVGLPYSWAALFGESSNFVSFTFAFSQFFHPFYATTWKRYLFEKLSQSFYLRCYWEFSIPFWIKLKLFHFSDWFSSFIFDLKLFTLTESRHWFIFNFICTYNLLFRCWYEVNGQWELKTSRVSTTNSPRGVAESFSHIRGNVSLNFLSTSPFAYTLPYLNSVKLVAAPCALNLGHMSSPTVKWLFVCQHLNAFVICGYMTTVV